MGSCEGKVEQKRAKMETSGDEPKKTVNGRKEGAGKEQETSSLSVAEGWESGKEGKQGEKGGKTVERKEVEANGFAKGGKRKQEEDEEEEDYDADTDVDEDKRSICNLPIPQPCPSPAWTTTSLARRSSSTAGWMNTPRRWFADISYAFNGTLEEYMTGEVQ
ncbi:uncharacterized protein LOC119599245 [Penaeus monodon]|uniref:uncharacterized protein LOC119599245 n=1 Tax=Penaeus monodon TaxID=6687 RepID=UPI0018A756AB|nr:uncharacterized protein LOC119599245 [Penaeus monodon]